MTRIIATALISLALSSTVAWAQTPAAPRAAVTHPVLPPKPAKPVAAKPVAAKPVAARATPVAQPQAPRTAKSLACSQQADAKGLHGAPRKSFMSSCKKA